MCFRHVQHELMIDHQGYSVLNSSVLEKYRKFNPSQHQMLTYESALLGMVGRREDCDNIRKYNLDSTVLSPCRTEKHFRSAQVDEIGLLHWKSPLPHRWKESQFGLRWKSVPIKHAGWL